jgi:hypothetical protein
MSETASGRPTCPQEELLALLAAQALEGEERSSLEAHVASCAACAKSFEEAQAVSRALRSLPMPEPSRAAKERAYAAVLAAMEARAGREPASEAAPRRAARPRSPWLKVLITAASGLAAAACLFVALSTTSLAPSSTAPRASKDSSLADARRAESPTPQAPAAGASSAATGDQREEKSIRARDFAKALEPSPQAPTASEPEPTSATTAPAPPPAPGVAPGAPAADKSEAPPVAEAPSSAPVAAPKNDVLAGDEKSEKQKASVRDATTVTKAPPPKGDDATSLGPADAREAGRGERLTDTEVPRLAAVREAAAILLADAYDRPSPKAGELGRRAVVVTGKEAEKAEPKPDAALRVRERAGDDAAKRDEDRAALKDEEARKDPSGADADAGVLPPAPLKKLREAKPGEPQASRGDEFREAKPGEPQASRSDEFREAKPGEPQASRGDKLSAPAGGVAGAPATGAPLRGGEEAWQRTSGAGAVNLARQRWDEGKNALLLEDGIFYVASQGVENSWAARGAVAPLGSHTRASPEDSVVRALALKVLDREIATQPHDVLWARRVLRLGDFLGLGPPVERFAAPLGKGAEPADPDVHLDKAVK